MSKSLHQPAGKERIFSRIVIKLLHMLTIKEKVSLALMSGSKGFEQGGDMFIAKSWRLRGPTGKQRAERLGSGRLTKGKGASTCDSSKCDEQGAWRSQSAGAAQAPGAQGRGQSPML